MSIHRFKVALSIIAVTCIGAVNCDGKNTTETDCDAIPEGPFEATEVPGSIAGEDFAFDDRGNIVGIDDYAIFKVPYDGEPELFVSGVYYNAGMAYDKDGNLLVADNALNALASINPDGESTVIASNLQWPNGIAVHPDGWVLVTEYAEDRVTRVDPATGATEIVAENIPGANGIAFGDGYGEVFVSSFWDGVIYSMTVDEAGDLGEPDLWGPQLDAQLDGLAVDECGNVYACGYSNGGVWRISPYGVEVSTILEPGVVEHATNLRFGSGHGGWKETSAYVSNYSSVFEIDLAVGGANRSSE